MVLKGICCWGTEYCKCQFLSLTRNQNVKLGYLFLILLALGISTIVGNAYQHSQLYLQLMGCDQDGLEQEGSDACVREQLQFRWALAVSLMHLLLMIAMLLRNQLSKILNEGGWLLKLLIVSFLGLINMFVMPVGILAYLHTVSAYLSIFWYIVQSLVIIDLIYTLDNFFNELAETAPKILLVKAVISIILTFTAVFLNAVSYLHHQAQPFVWIPVINSIVLVAGLVIVLLRVCKSNSLLVYSLVMISTNTMGYYYRMSSMEFSQSSYPYIQGSLIVITLLGTLGAGSNKVRTKKSSINELLGLNTSKEEEDNRYVSSNKWITYHYIFFAICLVVPCILNQHSSLSGQEQSEWDDIFTYYRIGGWIIFYLAYFWTLAAARIYSQQDFNQLEHYFKQFQLN